MKKKLENTGKGNEIETDSKDVVLTRRAAIKRLAKIMGGAVVGAAILGQIPQTSAQYFSSYMSHVYSSRYNPPYISFPGPGETTPPRQTPGGGCG